MLEDALASVDVAGIDSNFAEKVDAALTTLQDLENQRAGVTNRTLKVPQMAGYYSPLIQKFLVSVEAMVPISENAGEGLTARIGAYTQFLQGKERAGIERAMGAAGYGAGAFAPNIYRRFISLIAAQSTFFRSAYEFASPDDLAFAKQTLSGPVVEEVDRLRKIALDSPQTGTTAGIKAPVWFAAITKKIDLMKAVEAALPKRSSVPSTISAIMRGKTSRLSPFRSSFLSLPCWGFRSSSSAASPGQSEI